MSPRNVKILATLGPASCSQEKIIALVQAGVNVFRLNMSHGQHEVIREIHSYIRAAEQELGIPIAILGDLQGPKIRCGVFAEDKATLEEGQEFTFDLLSEAGDHTRVQLPQKEIFQVLKPNTKILVNDGMLEFNVTACDHQFASCVVVVGGVISNRKGVNVPSVLLPLSSLTEKDLTDLEFLCTLGVDWIALSFVQRAEDVLYARKLINGRARVVSKIEKPAALDDFDNILAATDGVMIARGDLGVELPIEQVPGAQKRLIRSSRATGKPVIVATQMLESMIKSPVPTRAEVSDIATAIFDGADAIMLSAESAAGDFPVEAVSTMVAVAKAVESDMNYRQILESNSGEGASSYRSLLTVAAREIAATDEIRAICCFTQSGYTALSQARERPQVPIYALTPDINVARFLTLVWGVNCRVVAPVDRFKKAVTAAVQTVNFAYPSEDGKPTGKIAVTAGVPIHKSGTTNILRLAALDGSDLYSFD